MPAVVPVAGGAAAPDRRRSHAGRLPRRAAGDAGAGDVPRERRRRSARAAVQAAGAPADRAVRPSSTSTAAARGRCCSAGTTDGSTRTTTASTSTSSAAASSSCRWTIGSASATAQAFQFAEHTGARGASEYRDVLAAGRYLQARPDVDPRRIGIWGASYGGYLTALGARPQLRRVRRRRRHPRRPRSAAGDQSHAAGARHRRRRRHRSRAEAGAARCSSSRRRLPRWTTWKSPVLLIHGDDDRTVDFRQTIDLARRLLDEGRQGRGARPARRCPRLAAVAKLDDRGNGRRGVLRERPQHDAAVAVAVRFTAARRHRR